MILRSASRRAVGARIFTASMADIVFLLIVFFILTYQPLRDRAKVELPRTVERIEVPEEAALISIDAPATGEIIRVTSGREMSMPVSDAEEIVTFASLLVAADPEQEFVIKADKNVRYERVDTVLEALKRSHVRNVFLLSEAVTNDS